MREGLVKADVAHADETGMWVEGQLHWLHVLSNDRLTYYAPHRKRGQKGMRDIGLWPRFKGWLVRDGLTSYSQFDKCRHALCNAHHLRELQFVVDRYAQPWAQVMIDLLLEMKTAVAIAQAEGQMRLTLSQQGNFEARYYAILEQACLANLPPAPPPTLGQKAGPCQTISPQKPAGSALPAQRTSAGFHLRFSAPLDP